MYDSFINTVFRFRWLVVIFTLIFITVASLGLQRIEVVSDYKSFIKPGYPALLQLEEVEQAFSETHNLLIAIAPNDKQIFTTEIVELIQRATQQFWQLPYAFRVDSISNYQYTEVDGDELLVGDLLPDDRPITQQLLDRAQRVTATEPMLKQNLISEQQHVAVISVMFEAPDEIGSAIVNKEILDQVNQAVDQYRKHYSAVSFYVTGVVTIDNSLNKYSKRDSVTLIPAMLGLMALVLFVMTRSFAGIISASMVVVFTGVGTMGMLGWSGWVIDPGSSISPIVIMTLAVADSIHVIEGMQNGMRQGLAKADAIRKSLTDNFVPVFLTSLTTVMGVVTFAFADLPSLSRLGITVALGVSLAFVLSVTLLPAILSLLPMKVTAKRDSSKIYILIGRFTMRHARTIVVLALLLSVFLISMAPLNRFNDSPGAMLALKTDERQAVEFYQDNVSGIIKIDVVMDSGVAGGVNDPAFLAKADALVSWLRSKNNIDHVATLTDTFKRLNQNMHADDKAWYRLPQQQDLAAQYLLLYEMSLPYGLNLTNQLNLDKSAIRMTVIVGDGDSQKIVETGWEIEAWFASNAPEYKVLVTGTTPILAELSYVHMIPSMMKGGMIAIMMVSLVLFGALRSVKLGFIGMLANVIPVSMGYGLWYLMNGQVNFIVASVAGVCLGVVVDFAVHFLSKYQRERNKGETTEQAILNTFAKTGRPLWTTMVVLVAGFWLLMLSPITMNFSMGYLTGIVIMLALVFDFLVLPAMLILFDNKKVTAAKIT